MVIWRRSLNRISLSDIAASSVLRNHFRIHRLHGTSFNSSPCDMTCVLLNLLLKQHIGDRRFLLCASTLPLAFSWLLAQCRESVTSFQSIALRTQVSLRALKRRAAKREPSRNCISELQSPSSVFFFRPFSS